MSRPTSLLSLRRSKAARGAANAPRRSSTKSSRAQTRRAQTRRTDAQVGLKAAPFVDLDKGAVSDLLQPDLPRGREIRRPDTGKRRDSRRQIVVKRRQVDAVVMVRVAAMADKEVDVVHLTNRDAASAELDDKGVIARAAAHRISAEPALQKVMARAAEPEIVASAADQPVIAHPADQPVMQKSRIGQIVVAHFDRTDVVIARPTIRKIGPAKQRIIKRGEDWTAIDDVIQRWFGLSEQVPGVSWVDFRLDYAATGTGISGLK